MSMMAKVILPAPSFGFWDWLRRRKLKVTLALKPFLVRLATHALKLLVPLWLLLLRLLLLLRPRLPFLLPAALQLHVHMLLSK